MARWRQGWLSGPATAAAAVLLVACSSFSPAEPPPPVAPRPPVLGDWDPPAVYRDEPYLQEVAEVVGSLSDVRALALDPEGVCHVAVADGLLRHDGSGWQNLGWPADRTSSDLAFDAAGTIAAVGPAGAILAGAPIDPGVTGTFTVVAPRAAGGFWLAGPDTAGYWEGGAYTNLFGTIGAPVRALLDGPDGAWFAATPDGVVTAERSFTESDGLPSNDVRALALGAEGVVWAGTAAGLGAIDPRSGTVTPFLGAQGLHYGDVRDLRSDGEDSLCVATSMGASRFDADGGRRYYLGRIWLPDDDVRAMARAADGTAWLGTAAGVARVEPRPLTLAEKAERFDAITAERHVRLGYTSTENRLATAGDVTSFSHQDNDNDGQWTGMYLASQSFRFAVTGDEAARSNARTAAYALLQLEQVTGKPGFFARSIVPGEECASKQQGEGEWHPSADGAWCWKGDTSSDEFVGHVFGLSLFHDLAATESERRDVAATLGRIVGAIVDDGFVLLDVDGLPTTHGHFDPDWMETALPALFGDAGLNSAMILGGLHAAYHLTGEAKFRQAFDYLARERDYVDYVSRIEEINLTIQTNHDSEEMSFLALYTLMRYEDDPALFAAYRVGLEGLWQVQRPERNPEFNVMYAALARAVDYDLAQSVETLQKLPLDLVQWGLDLGQRWDRDEAPEPDRFDQPQNRFVFPYDERQAMRWAENPYAYRLGGDGHQESSGTFWLLPYWMACYHRLII